MQKFKNFCFGLRFKLQTGFSVELKFWFFKTEFSFLQFGFVFQSVCFGFFKDSLVFQYCNLPKAGASGRV